jgi:3-deoxy-D-manno-octulosonate 8-phosphate phosphatase (KDO 8-P phosphatase)
MSPAEYLRGMDAAVLAEVAPEVVARARGIELAVFDVDGVMTDGRLYLTDAGEEVKAFNSRDGHGMKMLQACGIRTAIITGRTSRCVELRARNLSVQHLFQGVEDKRVAFEELLSSLSLDARQASFMGDDVVDLPVLSRCGLAVAVPEAPAIVRLNAHFVTRLAGGQGAVRELCELLMAARGRLGERMGAYLS